MRVEPKKQAPKTRAVRECVFGCGRRADSLEHAWSDWARARLGTEGIGGEVDGVSFYEPQKRHLRVRCVCVPCNTGWMSRLEDAVIPFVGRMMIGQSVSLTSDAQAAIAAWAVKTSMVIEFTSRSNAIFYTEDERTTLRTRSQGPSATAVLLAHTTDVPNFYTKADDAIGDLKGHPLRAHITTLAYRSLVVQVFSVRAQVLPPRINLHGNHGDWTGCFQRLSGQRGSVSWPPSRPIPPGDLDAFHRRLLP